MASIEPFIHRKVVVLHQDAPTSQAARAMSEHRIGCVMVADHNGHLVGILTDRDLVCRAETFPPSANQKIYEVMSKNLVTIDELARVEDVILLMETHGVRRIPVVHRKPEGGERCVGIVTLDDLIASRSISQIRLSRIVQSQMFRRRSAVFGRAEAVHARGIPETRDEETLRYFYRVVGEKTGLDIETVEPMINDIFIDLVLRLNYTAAALLIAQLPRGLRDELMDLPAGPDRTIAVASIGYHLAERFGFDQNMCKLVLTKFWEALKELVPAGTLNHVLEQLPLDFYEVFTPVAFEAA